MSDDRTAKAIIRDVEEIDRARVVLAGALHVAMDGGEPSLGRLVDLVVSGLARAEVTKARLGIEVRELKEALSREMDGIGSMHEMLFVALNTDPADGCSTMTLVERAVERLGQGSPGITTGDYVTGQDHANAMLEAKLQHEAELMLAKAQRDKAWRTLGKLHCEGKA
jgi:hypothetical protein